MENNGRLATGNKYDTAIIGGGLAGLSLSIQLARLQHRVILFEKEHYPFHRVCGEYISMESWDFLQQLGLPLPAMNLPRITRLQVSGPNGKISNHPLPLGGFGISRFLLDNELMKLARKSGVTILENTRVNDVQVAGNDYLIETPQQQFTARMAVGCFGKRSSIDIKWKRPFTEVPANKLNNYVGIKYHIRTEFPSATIALHNFSRGYCGISKVEDEKYCLCYLTSAINLQQYHGDIAEMEKQVLSQNPHLKKIFDSSERLYPSPLTISQISFDKKSQVERHLPLVGDAAGMITPLCGNGMSMALHGSKLLVPHVQAYLEQQLSRQEMELSYKRDWQLHFASRLRTGRRIQRLFGGNRTTHLFINLANRFPRIATKLIRQTHGQPF